VERDHPIYETVKFREFVGGFVDECAEFKFTFVIEKIDVVHFAIAFATADTAVIADFKVFFATAAASACF